MRPIYYVFAAVGVALASVAAYISINGMARVFAGSAATVMVAMTAIEAGKLTCASLAYRMRGVAPRPLTAFLATATLATMLITSAGIYGFLSAAYQESASAAEARGSRVAAMERRAQQFERRVERLDTRAESVAEQQRQQQRRIDALSARYAERGWASDREALQDAQRRADRLRETRSEIDSDITAYSDSVSALERRALEVEQGGGAVDAKLSTVRFIAQVVGIPQDQAANIFILMIVFVFDPVAVCIIIATNMASEHTGDALFERTLGDTGQTPRSGDESAPESAAEPEPVADDAPNAERASERAEEPEAVDTEPEPDVDAGAGANGRPDGAADEQRSTEEPSDYVEDEQQMRDTEREINDVVRSVFGAPQETRFRVHEDASVTRKHA